MSSVDVLTRRPPAIVPFAACVGSAWIAAAALYLAVPGHVPEPAVGTAVGTAVGLLVATTGALSGRRRAPSPPPPPAPRTAPPRAAYAYPQRDPDERQCPNCGGFAVTRAGPSASCTTCDHRWSVDPAAPPAVSIRSWLHRQPPAQA